MGSSTGRAPLFLISKQIQVMSTIYLELPVDTDEVLEGVDRLDEEDFLLDALETFSIDNVTDALREYFGSRAARRESLPDFIDPTKL